MFYFHWKNIVVFENTVFQFDESSAYLLGWFRDYLWFDSSAVINGYSAIIVNNLSWLAWLFLAAHLLWATGFMFLISWRGYWQELIDIIIYNHIKSTVIGNLMLSINSPSALSIIQARLVV